MTMLSETEVRVLHEALDDEYRAWATCDQSIAGFGEARQGNALRQPARRACPPRSKTVRFYEQLLASTQRPDIVAVFRNLPATAQTKGAN